MREASFFITRSRSSRYPAPDRRSQDRQEQPRWPRADVRKVACCLLRRALVLRKRIGNQGKAAPLVIDAQNAERLCYSDSRLTAPFAGNTTAWMAGGYLDINGRLLMSALRPGQRRDSSSRTTRR